MSSWLIRVLVMLKHSNSDVTSVIIRNSNFSICPNIPRSALGNMWDSQQSRWSPGGTRSGGRNRLIFLSQSPGKVFSEVFPALTRDCVFKDKWVCNTFHLHISFDPAWGHDVMISGSDQIVKSIFSHESQATWYEPRSCIWLRVILPSRTRCWTPPPVTDIYLEIEPQRCSMTTGTPRTNRRWHRPTLEWLSSLYQLQ